MRYDQQDIAGGEDFYEASGIISRWLPASARVLDVGCGTGAITLRVTQGKNNEIVGIEPDPVRAETARGRGIDVVTGFLDEAFLAARGPFDVILFADVLEHLPAPPDIIMLAAKGLRPGGSIIASVPNVAHWTVRFRLLLGRFNYTDYGIMDATHLRWFTRKTFVALFERSEIEHSKFEVVELAASAGTWLSEYQRFPFNLLPKKLRFKMIQSLSQKFPGLFACQHIALVKRT